MSEYQWKEKYSEQDFDLQSQPVEFHQDHLRLEKIRALLTYNRQISFDINDLTAPPNLNCHIHFLTPKILKWRFFTIFQFCAAEN